MDNSVNEWWQEFKTRWQSAKKVADDTTDAIESSAKDSFTKREVADLIQELIDKVGDCRIYDAVEGLYCDIPTGGHDAQFRCRILVAQV